jgi:hypothetical protein
MTDLVSLLPGSRAVRRAVCLLVIVVIGWLLAGAAGSTVRGQSQPPPSPASHHTVSSYDVLGFDAVR